MSLPPDQHVNGEGVQKWKLPLIPASPGRVLDIGCGISEPYRQIFEERTNLYIPADIRPGAMIQADVLNLPFPDAAFDYIWCSELLEHLGGRISAEKALSEMKRVGRHGCATWPLPSHPHFFLDPGHIDPEITPTTIRSNKVAILTW